MRLRSKAELRHFSARRSAFTAWLGIPESTMPSSKISTAMAKDPEGTNKFLKSELFVEKCNLVQWQHLPEAKFLTPDTVLKDELPRAHEGPRHWTERAMSAQQTGSESFATVVLSSLFNGVQCSTKQLGIIFNLTPYHGNVETQAFELVLSQSWTGPRLCSFSATWEAQMLTMSKKSVKDYVFRAWKSRAADELLGVDPNSEAYKVDAPVFMGAARKPNLQVLTVSEDGNSLKVPQDMVQLYGRDPLRKDEWLKIVKDVENMFGSASSLASSLTSATTTTSPTAASTPVTPAVTVAFPGCEDLMLSDIDTSKIFCKFPGKDKVYSWVILSEGDSYKGYIVCETNALCKAEGLALAYGRGQWSKGKLAEDVANLDSPSSRDVLCKFESLTNDLMVLEGPKGDGPLQNWVDLVMQVVKDAQSGEGHMSDITISTHKVLDVHTSDEVKLSNALANPEKFTLRQKESITFKPDPLNIKPDEHRHTNAAGLPPRKALADSPALLLVWRVKYFEPCQEVAPRKPLCFFRLPITLSKKGEMRRVF